MTHTAAPHPAALPDSRTWILLRGLTRGQGHWGRFPEQLQVALPPGHRVFTPDLPGNGQAHQRHSPARVEAMVEALRADLAAEGLQPPFHVLAMSLGAMVTVAWSHAHPHELCDAVLVNTSLKPYSPMWRRLQPRQYPRILRLLWGKASSHDWEHAILEMTTRHPIETSPEAVLAHWIALREQHPVSTANGLRQLWAATRYRAPRQAPPMPTLLLRGAGDQLVHPSCSAVLAASWESPLITHPTAGHDLPLDAGPWVIQQVTHWLAMRSPTPPVP